MSGRQPDLADLNKRMDSALEVLRKDLQGLRTGRASASLLESIVVEAYGSELPLTQVGTVNVPEPRMLTVQVWDRGLVKAVDKAIRNSSLGLNPSVDGQLLRVPLPELTPSGATSWSRWRTATPSKRGSRSATCAVTAWTSSSGWKRTATSRRTSTSTGPTRSRS